MKRRLFLQQSLSWTTIATLVPAIGFAAPGDDAYSVISLIQGRTWTHLGTTGRLLARDDKVYCELMDSPRSGMTMVIRNYVKAKEDIASGKIAERLRGNEGIDKFLAHDGEGRLILTKDLSDAAKWFITGGGSTEQYKLFKTDRDDTLSSARVTHAVGFAKNRYFLGLDTKQEFYEINDGYGGRQKRTIQQLILAEKEDPDLAIWINDFSGK